MPGDRGEAGRGRGAVGRGRAVVHVSLEPGCTAGALPACLGQFLPPTCWLPPELEAVIAKSLPSANSEFTTQHSIGMPLGTSVNPSFEGKKICHLTRTEMTKADVMCENGQRAPFLDIGVEEGDGGASLG